ncbi:hypothetical protein LXA47_00165 [Massilia sp. P8910]|uniref:hypothetical protein n=1 Tax=Massilia antarctica TaxID=2765360 RepID=UPI001E4742FE|nr:hypothetical protein [Massilia antarctica]MCE3602028.1 hypothetical protein [Massilia antarctica]
MRRSALSRCASGRHYQQLLQESTHLETGLSGILLGNVSTFPKLLKDLFGSTLGIVEDIGQPFEHWKSGIYKVDHDG